MSVKPSREIALALVLLALVVVMAAGPAAWPAAWPEVNTQNPAQERPTTGLLMGVVFDPLNNRPVANVQVTLGGNTAGVPHTQVLTDGEGHFVFLDLPPGTYTLTALAPGYAEGAYGRRRPEGQGQSIPLAAAERLGDVRIPIWKLASISGTVRDEAGEPLVATPIRALRRTIVAGRRALAPGPTMLTDDRGVYRFGALVPGDYVVAAPSTQAAAPISVVELYRDLQGRGAAPPGQPDLSRDFSFSGATDLMALFAVRQAGTKVGELAVASSSGRFLAAAPPPGSDGRPFVYPAQYHMDALAAAQATTITLRSGEERLGVDLQLKLVPAVRVSGIVNGPQGPMIAMMTLAPDSDLLSSDTGLETATTISDAAGRFTFMGVPPGQYRLRALRAEVPAGVGGGSRGGAPPAPPAGTRATTTPAPAATPQPGFTLSASETVTVGTSHIDGLSIVLRPGFRIAGRAEFPNAATPVDPLAIRRMAVAFDPADARPFASATIGRGLIDETGQFGSYQLLPGRYFLRISNAPPGWTLKSAMWNGQDITNVAVRLDRDISGVVATFTNRPSTVSGQAQTVAGAADPTATVLVFPADAGAWAEYGDTPRRLRAIRVGQDGGFQIIGLPPGDYLVAAVAEESTANWQDAESLRALSRVATSMSLGADESRTLTLKTTAVSR